MNSKLILVSKEEIIQNIKQKYSEEMKPIEEATGVKVTIEEVKWTDEGIEILLLVP